MPFIFRTVLYFRNDRRSAGVGFIPGLSFSGCENTPVNEPNSRRESLNFGPGYRETEVISEYQ